MPVSLSAAALALLVLSCADRTSPESLPHIVLILADDMGWGDLASYGHPIVKTPHLDRIANEGSRFDQFYVQAPICSPTRAGILTGQYPARLSIFVALATAAGNESAGIPDWLDPEVPTIADSLHARGYRTAVFGKWHLGRLAGAPEPGAYGFDEHRTVNSAGPGWEDRGTEKFRARSTGLIVDEAIRFLEECERDGVPGFVNCWTLIPHDSLAPTDEEYALYTDAAVTPVTFPEPTRSYLANAPRLTAQMRTYCAAVSGLDREVGRLLDYLDDAGIADRTLFLFTSDNGPDDYHVSRSNHAGAGSTGPFRGRKRSLYEGGIRMPLLVRWPGHVPAGRVDDESVLTGLDIPATLLGIASGSDRGRPPGGTPHQATFPGDGVDRSGALLGTSAGGRPPLYWIWPGRHHGAARDRSPGLAVRDGRWKLHADLEGAPAELYDLEADPGESVNRIDEEPEIADRLTTLLRTWHASLPARPD
ncbi:MAG: sulfatase-like hydrolase/transferase [Gemmatimonadetes bacterium]|nr:sulfatase-like hydrolase/transferase [Gemmatimonadota bacterium]